MTFKKNILLFFLLALFIFVSAQNSIKLWDGTEMTQKQKWNELFVFLPERQNNSGISVIICPGGSYYWLDMDNEGFSVARYLNKQGITAFVLKYRTAKRGNHHPAMIQDLQRATQLVQANSKKYGIDPEKIGIMGFSAGGHLAGIAAIYAKPYFSAMIYPVVSMEDSIGHKKSRKNLLGKNYSDDLKQTMSLEKNVHADMPPIFLLHCTGDKTVDYRNSVVFAKALTEKNIKHQFLLIDEYGHGGHGFGIQPNGKATGWIEIFLKWLCTQK
ncbi:MAG: alpha/beta hydrolase [Lentimicrobiaceae bacterium]|nr:alpha/beta hydrolase [Lentimicrobiaceae bacterium]